MRLLNIHTLDLEEFFGSKIPAYAILSHTWGDDEVSFQDWPARQSLVGRRGYDKITAACAQVREYPHLSHIWVDTNCINKESSAELTEAINSMYVWYRRASVCFVYLEDFHYRGHASLAKFGQCRWFSRGWTLQELLAPYKIRFFDAAWHDFGTKQTLQRELLAATGIPSVYLDGDNLREASISARMSWVALRSTTREEDMAYCLLGLFDVNMPLLYGEGPRAFIRLQEEIIRHDNDQTIFCWSLPPLSATSMDWRWNGCLAPHPLAFRESGDYVRSPTLHPNLQLDRDPAAPPRPPGASSEFQLTNSGLRISLPMLHHFGALNFADRLVVLNVVRKGEPHHRVCLCLRQLGDRSAYQRSLHQLLIVSTGWIFAAEHDPNIYLLHSRHPPELDKDASFYNEARFCKTDIDIAYMSFGMLRSLYAVMVFTDQPSVSAGDRFSASPSNRGWMLEAVVDLTASPSSEGGHLWTAELLARHKSCDADILVDVVVDLDTEDDDEGPPGEWRAGVRLRDYTAPDGDGKEIVCYLDRATEFTLSRGPGLPRTRARPLLLPLKEFIGPWGRVGGSRRKVEGHLEDES